MAEDSGSTPEDVVIPVDGDPGCTVQCTTSEGGCQCTGGCSSYFQMECSTLLAGAPRTRCSCTRNGQAGNSVVMDGPAAPVCGDLATLRRIWTSTDMAMGCGFQDGMFSTQSP